MGAEAKQLDQGVGAWHLIRLIPTTPWPRRGWDGWRVKLRAIHLLIHGPVAELADAWDLKSQARQRACGFDPRRGHCVIDQARLSDSLSL